THHPSATRMSERPLRPHRVARIDKEKQKMIGPPRLRSLQTAPGNAESLAGGAGMRILAVDDDQDFLDAIQFHFASAGIDLVTCPWGYKALELLEEARFDVVMVDLVMPVMDGCALARHIRRRPRHSDLPVVMMTQMANVPFITAAGPGDA